MKIVILDGVALSDNNLSYEPFSEFGEVTIYDNSAKDEVISRIADAEVVITNKIAINKTVMDACPNIKYIGLQSTGFNIVDIEYAREKGITVTNVPEYSTDAVAQHVFSLILHFYNKVAEHNNAVMQGDWIKSKNFCFYFSPLHELRDKTIGIIGFGNIGKQVAKIAKAFNMNVVYYTRTLKDDYQNEGYRYLPLEELFSVSDIVSIHCPLTDETRNLVNSRLLSLMKRNAILINTARGPIVDEEALANALNTGRIAGAGLDVLSKEPMREDNPLFRAKNCVITPHIAWAPYETRKRCLEISVNNLRCFLNGNTINKVN